MLNLREFRLSVSQSSYLESKQAQADTYQPDWSRALIISDTCVHFTFSGQNGSWKKKESSLTLLLTRMFSFDPDPR